MTAGSTAAIRPRNRRQLIVEAAGRVFSERGYHAASMEEIAAGVGITAAALYRHFPNKYALFAECANVMVDRLVAAVDEVPPEAALAEVLAAVTRVTVAHRASGGAVPVGGPVPRAGRTAGCSGRSSRTSSSG